MAALIAKMKLIKKAYLHSTDLGENIFEWKTDNFQESDLPGMSLRDLTEDIEVRGTNHKHVLSIELEIKVQASTSLAIARQVMADVMVAVGQCGNLGGLIFTITPVNNELLDFEKGNKRFGTILLSFNIEYATKAFQPYS